MNTLSVFTRTSFFLFVLTSLFLLAPMTTARGSSDDASAASKNSDLSRVDHKYVCMITNQRYDKEQIPTSVEGKTYYGCCEMCKAKLQNDSNTRFAVDPVSGNVVDKALAVIGAVPDGKVYYFENEENLKSFKSKTDKES